MGGGNQTSTRKIANNKKTTPKAKVHISLLHGHLAPEVYDLATMLISLTLLCSETIIEQEQEKDKTLSLWSHVSK